MTNLEMAKEIINKWRYKILDEDDEHLVIRYQLNRIHICPSGTEEPFMGMMLPNFSDVDENNISDVIMRCHKLNERLKQVKLYTVNDVLVASSEFYFLTMDDLEFQMRHALNDLVNAKVEYRQYE